MIGSRWRVGAAALAGLVLTGLFIVSPGPALGQPGPRDRIRERCEAALPRPQVDPIVTKYRDRFASARAAMVREERALRALLVAENSTRAALDAQVVRTEAARSALSRARLDMLWELRGVIPATNREVAFRCAEMLLRRR